METLDIRSFASGSFGAVLDTFFSELDTGDPESFFEALAAFRGVDLSGLASSHLSGVAQRYFESELADRGKLAIYLPHFGHVRIASRNDVWVSFSLRSSLSASAFSTLSTSSRNEYHRIQKGTALVTECVSSDSAGSGRYLPASCRTLEAGDEFRAKAGASAFFLQPYDMCHVFSVTGWLQTPFANNIDTGSGAIVSQAFAAPADGILVNVLELCALLCDSDLGRESLIYTTHGNHRVRLAALKSALAGGAIDPLEVADLALRDEHKGINHMGRRMKEALL